ncbi:MAG: DUF3084 domain-containing protein [Armatimonadetes bacterium]|nr:DUF3084 domain-containing protein [Armatimonadota bacterium]
MNVFLLITLIGLPIAGAVIAWLGDLIGYRVGKSRRTVFGLRPRTTARLIGVVVGAVLPLLGLGMAAVGSQQVRTALLHLQDIQQRNRELAMETEKLLDDQKRLREEAKKASTAAEEARREASAARGQLNEAQQQLDALEGQLSQAQRGLSQVRSQLSTARKTLAQAHQRLAALQQQRDSLQQRVRNLQAEAKRLSDKLALADQQARKIEQERLAALARLRETTQKLSEAEARRDAALGEAEKLRAEADELRAAVADLERQRQQLANETELYKRRLSETTSELEAQQKKLADAERQVRAAGEYLERLRAEFARRLAEERLIEESPVVIEPGEEIVRATVSARQTRDQLEATLAETMVLANQAAVLRGVVPDARGKALILVRPLPPRAVPGERLDEEDIIYGVAERMLSSGEESFLVLVRSLERHFAAERRPLMVEMRITPDKVRFRANEVILTLRFEAGVAGAEVLRRLLGLRTRLREIAQDRGLLPDPRTGEYGVLLADQMLEAVERVSKAKTPTELRVLAARDVRTAEPLAVNLEVRAVRG